MVDISALFYWEMEPLEYRDFLAVSLSNKILSYLIVKLFFSVVQIRGGRVAENMFVRFPLRSFSSRVAFLKFCLLWSLWYIWSVLFSIWTFLAMYSYVRQENQRATLVHLCKENCDCLGWGSLPASILRSQTSPTEPAFYVLCDCVTSPLTWSPASTDLSKLKEESYSAFLRSLGKRDLIVF